MNYQKNSWWIEGLKGLLVLILGIICLVNPAGALAAIAIYLGILAIAAGLGIVIVSVAGKGSYWQFWIVEGFFNLIIGILLVSFPKAAIHILIVFISLWIIAMGILQLFTYSNLRKSGHTSNLVLFTAILSLLIGILFLFNPFEGAKVVAIILGIFALIYGVSSLITAFQLLGKRNPRSL
ncbi:MAG TPA: hypothetical protein ENO20_05355 [Bacteroides sp.]|nr:hypothetical protein [Bacteroides sp.]